MHYILVRVRKHPLQLDDVISRTPRNSAERNKLIQVDSSVEDPGID